MENPGKHHQRLLVATHARTNPEVHRWMRPVPTHQTSQRKTSQSPPPSRSSVSTLGTYFHRPHHRLTRIKRVQCYSSYRRSLLKNDLTRRRPRHPHILPNRRDLPRSCLEQLGGVGHCFAWQGTRPCVNCSSSCPNFILTELTL